MRRTIQSTYPYLLMLFTIWLSAAMKPKDKVRIFLVGDSLMAEKKARAYPLTGWGQVLGEYFNAHVSVINLAQDGRTTRSFVKEGCWQKVLDTAKAGDYIFIGFAHNDEKIALPEIGVPINDYTAYLTKFVKEAKAIKAVPILLTPVMRRNFVAGTLRDTHGVYADAVREVARTENVPLIDLQRKTEEIVTALGDEPSKQLYNWIDSAAYKAYPKGAKDNTHLSITGARKVAGLVADEIKTLHLPLATYLN